MKKKAMALGLVLSMTVAMLAGCGGSGGGSSGSGSSGGGPSAIAPSASSSEKQPTTVTDKEVTVEGCKGAYTGPVNDEGLPDGKGSISFSSGGHEGATYEGDFVAGRLQGSCVYTFANGDQYTGEYSEDDFNGNGTYVFKDGSVFEGVFNGSTNATGVYTDTEGNQWNAELKDSHITKGEQLQPGASSTGGSSSSETSGSSSASSSSSSGPGISKEDMVTAGEAVLAETYDDTDSYYDSEADAGVYTIVMEDLAGVPGIYGSPSWDDEISGNWDRFSGNMATLCASLRDFLRSRYPEMNAVLYVASSDQENGRLLTIENGEITYTFENG